MFFICYDQDVRLHNVSVLEFGHLRDFVTSLHIGHALLRELPRLRENVESERRVHLFPVIRWLLPLLLIATVWTSRFRG